MIKNIIQVKVKPRKANDLKTLYQHHFKALKKAGDKVKSYEVFINREDDTIAYSMKMFDNEADVNTYSNSKKLEEFLGELKGFLDGGADYHECTLIAAL